MSDRDRVAALVPGVSLFHVVAVTAVFIVVYCGFTIAGNAARSYKLTLQTRELQGTIARDQEMYSRLDALRRYMRTDAFIEAAAREEGLARPGDTAVAVSGPPTPTQPGGSGGAWWERYYGR